MSDEYTQDVIDETAAIYAAWIAQPEAGVLTVIEAERLKNSIRERVRGGAPPANIELEKFIARYYEVRWNETEITHEDRITAARGFWSGIKDFFRELALSVWGGLRAAFTFVIGDLITAIRQVGTPYNKTEARKAYQEFIDAKILNPDAINELEKVFGKTKFSQLMIPLIGISATGIELVKGIMSTAGGDYAKHLMSIFTPGQPDIASLVRLGFISPSASETVRKKLSENGLSEEDQNIMFTASLNMLEINDLRILFLRGHIDQAEVYRRAAQVGFTQDKIEDIMKTWEVFPNTQDIVYLAAKEAFEDDIVSKYGYDQEFPIAQLPLFKYNGVSEDTARLFWNAHWAEIPLQQAFEMLHRRIITAGQLQDIFKVNEIPPGWRAELTALSYRPLTRVDVRRMYDMDVLGEQEVLDAYLDLGYSPLNAERMTEFTIKYTQDEERELTRTQIESYYKTKLINRDTALEYLIDLGYNQTRAEYFLDFQDFEEEQEYIEAVIDNTGEMYMNRFMDEPTAREVLYGLDIPTKRVSALFDSWNISIYKDRKLPSKTDLGKFLEAGIIDVLTYAEELEKLGYPERYISMYTELASNTGSK